MNTTITETVNTNTYRKHQQRDFLNRQHDDARLLCYHVTCYED